MYGMLYVLVYHQYSFVKEIGPPQPQHTWKWTKDVSVVMCRVCVCVCFFSHIFGFCSF